jgi:hypothetical protein
MEEDKCSDRRDTAESYYKLLVESKLDALTELRSHYA